MNIVGISGGLTVTSKTVKLVDLVLGQISRLLDANDVAHTKEIFGLADQLPLLNGVLWRNDASQELEARLQRIEAADVIVLAAPVYRTAYPGLFKHFLDLLDRKGFEKKLVVLGGCGGSLHHALMLEQQLRPLVSNLGAYTLPTGLFTQSSDYSKEAVINQDVSVRIQTVLNEFAYYYRLPLTQFDAEKITAAN